jgi:hypothetical protein
MRDLSWKKDVDVIVDQLVVCLETHMRDGASSDRTQEDCFDFFVTIFLQRQFIQPSASRRWNEVEIARFPPERKAEYLRGRGGIKKGVLRIVSARRVCRYAWHGWERPHSGLTLHVWSLMPLARVSPPPAVARRSSPWRDRARWRRPRRREPAPAGQSWHTGCRGHGGSAPGVGACRVRRPG